MPISTGQIHWAAGFLEGEGSFYYRGTPRVSATQVQREPLDRLERLFGGRITLGVTSQGRPIHNWHVCGPMAAGIMQMLYGLLSPRRKEQVRNCMLRWRAAMKHQKYRKTCPKGHPYDSFKNKDGSPHRRCSICKNESARLRAPRYDRHLLRLVPDSRQDRLA